jgi:hypothetical protein
VQARVQARVLATQVLVLLRVLHRMLAPPLRLLLLLVVVVVLELAWHRSLQTCRLLARAQVWHQRQQTCRRQLQTLELVQAQQARRRRPWAWAWHRRQQTCRCRQQQQQQQLEPASLAAQRQSLQTCRRRHRVRALVWGQSQPTWRKQQGLALLLLLLLLALVPAGLQTTQTFRRGMLLLTALPWPKRQWRRHLGREPLLRTAALCWPAPTRMQRER